LFRYGSNGNGNCSVADSLDPRLNQELKDKLESINQKRCKPSPLPQSELGQIWKDAVAYYTKKKKEGGRGEINQGKLSQINRTKIMTKKIQPQIRIKKKVLH
jgi:hypothetical protein